MFSNVLGAIAFAIAQLRAPLFEPRAAAPVVVAVRSAPAELLPPSDIRPPSGRNHGSRSPPLLSNLHVVSLDCHGLYRRCLRPLWSRRLSLVYVHPLPLRPNLEARTKVVQQLGVDQLISTFVVQIHHLYYVCCANYKRTGLSAPAFPVLKRVLALLQRPQRPRLLSSSQIARLLSIFIRFPNKSDCGQK